jgi:hypothetical protein
MKTKTKTTKSKNKSTKCISKTPNGTYRVRKTVNGVSYDKTVKSMTKAVAYRNSLS